MYSIKKLLLLLFWSLPIMGWTQKQLSYTNYTIKDGLAGNTVYCVTQDKEGFIWFGTETGLSRYDGTHFKNYGIQDGLPDNEIIELFCDSKGRVWFAPFKKAICYYYKGVIHNQENDSLLKKIAITNPIFGFCEDRQGNIYVNQQTRLTILRYNGVVNYISSINNQPFSKMMNMVSTKDGILLYMSPNLYSYDGQNFTLLKTVPYLGVSVNSSTLSNNYFVVENDAASTGSKNKIIVDLLSNTEVALPSDNKYISQKIMEDSLLFVSKPVGCLVYHLKHLNKHPDTLLKNIDVGKVYKDKEGILWFTSLKSGIYKLSSKHVYAFTNNKNSSYHFINKMDAKVIIANNSLGLTSSANNFETSTTENLQFPIKAEAKILDIIYTKDKKIVFTSAAILVYENNRLVHQTPVSLKHLQKLDDSTFLVSTSFYVAYLHINRFKKDAGFGQPQIIWKERATCSYPDGDSIFVGSLNGLFVVKKDTTDYCLSKIDSRLERRVSAIQKGPDGTMWIGTYDAGIIAYKNGKVIQTFDAYNGLTSNICRNFYQNAGYLYVGTDKGLNKIDIHKAPYKMVITYTTADGLASNMINAIYKDSSTLFIGTAEGLSFFKEEQLALQSICDLQILGITISSKEQYWNEQEICLPHKDNNIRFDFVAISYKSAGDIVYSYRLIGLDEEWKTTRENYLSYPSLPSGNYTMELQATNKFGQKSTLLKIPFTIQKYFYEYLLVKILFFVLSFMLGIFYFKKRLRKIKEKAKEKEQTNAQIFELEQSALKAKMNPHFIYNSLNTLQHFIITNDLYGANQYISTFASLIRKTLDFSFQKEITLEEEISYLETYLSIEKTRFEHQFDYTIEAEKALQLSSITIPPLLLQTFVENSIKHNIQSTKKNKLQITIDFTKEGKLLICKIVDNGLGVNYTRNAKSEYDHTSKGIDLVKRNLEVMNAKNKTNTYTLSITDNMQTTQTKGTTVLITLPI
jgi:ligand-binding sensor domain-containing protein